MRVLGQIPHPQLLISVIKSNNKIFVKFEVGPFEQVYKFLETELIHDLDSVSKLLNDSVYTEVFRVFDSMNVIYKNVHNG